MGSFEDGLYVYQNEAGKRRTIDGYQAAWEKTFGRKLEYPQPRFNAPVVLQPDKFSWIQDVDNPLVEKRMLGVFNERGLTVTQVRLSSGAELAVDGAQRPWLAYVLSGTGNAAGENWSQGSAVHIDRNENVTLRAADKSELYLFGLPTFDDRQA